MQISLVVCTAANQQQWEHRVLSESGMCEGGLQPPLVLGVQIWVSSLTVYTSQQIHSPLFFVKVWVMSSRAGLTIGAPVNARHWGLVEKEEAVENWLMYRFRASHSTVHWKSYLKFFTWSSTVVNARALSKALTK